MKHHYELNRLISVLLVLCVIATFMPMLAVPAQAALTDTKIGASISGNTDEQSIDGTSISAKVRTSYIASSNKKYTITLTNNSGAEATLSFVYSFSNSASNVSRSVKYYTSSNASAVSVSLTSGSTFKQTLQAGGKVEVYAEGGNGATVTTNLTDISLKIKTTANVSFVPDSSVSYTVGYVDGDGASQTASVAAGGTENVTVEAELSEGLSITPADGYICESAVGSTSKTVFADKNGEFTFAKNETVTPVFLSSDTVKPFTHLGLSESYATLGAAVNAGSGTVVLNQSYTLPAGNYEIPYGVQFLIPYSDANTFRGVPNEWTLDDMSMTREGFPDPPEDNIVSAKTYSSTACTEYRRLTLSEGASITVNGALEVSGQTHPLASGQWGNYALLQMGNNTSITVGASGALYAYGFIRGNGTVTVESSGVVYEHYDVADYPPGGAGGLDPMNTAGVFGMTNYTFNNIEVSTTYKAGAKMKAYLVMTGYNIGTNAFIREFIGSDDNAVFNLKSGTIQKTYSGSRQNLVIAGDVEFNKIYININALVVNYTVDSSKTSGLPISHNWDITINNNATATLNGSVLMYAGSTLTIENGSKLVIPSGIKFSLLDSASDPSSVTTSSALDLNGEIQVSGGFYNSYTGTTIPVIKSSGGTGKVTVNNVGTETTFNVRASGNNTAAVNITPAQLQNADGSVVKTGSGGVNAYTYTNGKWICTTHTETETVTTAATCESAGEKTITCTVCGTTRTEEIAALGHKDENPKDHTCDNGCDVYQDIHANGTNTHICAYCDKAASECSDAAGDKDHKCDICGKTCGTCDANTEIPAVAATCTTTGFTAGTMCSECGSVQTERTETAKLGHKYQLPAVKFSEDGKTYTVTVNCTVCAEGTEGRTKTSEARESTVSGTTAGNCQTNSTTTYSASGTFENVAYSETKTVEGAKGDHSYDDGTVTPPTCEDEGYTTYTCQINGCNHSYQNTPTDALGHQWTNACDTNCNREGCTKTRDINHDYEAVVTPPTFDARGYTTYTCSVCSDSYVDNYVSALVAVAQVGENKYKTLAEAVAAAQSGDTVTVLMDATLTERLTISKLLTLDLGGKTITADFTDDYGPVYVGTKGDLIITGNGTIVSKQDIVIANYGKATIENGTFKSEAGEDGYNAALYNMYYSGTVYGTAVIKGGTFESAVWNSGALTVERGTLNDIDNSGKLTITGGTVNGTIYAGDGSDTADLAEKGTIVISGGSFSEKPDAAWCAEGYGPNGSAVDGYYGVHKHVEGTEVVENNKAATCTADGSYDTVIRCTACDESLSSKHTTVPMLGHVDANNDGDHTCDRDGCTEIVTVCGDDIKDHICDTDSACEVYKIGDNAHKDTNSDHKCDYGCIVAFGICEDTNKDHKCDYGCKKTYGEHTDAADDEDHVCDYCGKTVENGESCSDATNDTDHNCDVCGKENVTGCVFDQEVADEKYLNTEADCINAATYFKSCLCGAKGTETFENGKANGHYMDKTEAKAATCSATGNNAYWTCSVCKNVYADEDGNTETTVVKQTIAIDPDAHSWGEWSVTSSATCTAAGEKTRICVHNSEHTEKQNVTKIAHSMTHYDRVEATCIAEGNVEYWYCSACGLNYSDEAGNTELETVVIAIDSNNHVNKTEQDQANATCLAVGYTAGTYCKDCKTWINGHEEIPAIGHKNKEYHEKVAATCVKTGTIEYWSCPDCGKNFSDEACTTEVMELTIAIDPNNHVNKIEHSQTDATCTESGYTAGTYCEDCDKWISGHEEISAKQHSWTVSYKWSADGKSCTATRTCGNDASHNVTETVTASGIVKTAATCKAMGWTTYTANFTAKWAETQTKDMQDIAQLEHSYTGAIKSDGNGKDATHSFKCVNGCNEYGKTVKHSWEEGVIDLGATCTEAGTKTYSCTADGCGATYTESVSATGHTFDAVVVAKETTCLAAGNEAYKQCTVCNKYFAADAVADATDGKDDTTSFVIAKKDHSYTGAIKSDGNGKEATHSFMCVNGCNQYGAAVKHSWNEGKVITEPKCESTGVRTYTCTVEGCGATYVEDVAALDHAWETTLSKDETQHWYDCSRCDATKDVAEHSYEWKTTTEATCYTDGSQTGTCTCGATTTDVIKATGKHVYSKSYTTEDGKHWKACTTSGCMAKIEEADCSDVNTDQDHLCDICKADCGDHSYGEPVFAWNGYECSAKVACDCGDEQSVNVNVTSEVTTVATCKIEGIKTYTATAVYGEKTYTETKTENLGLDPANHNMTAGTVVAPTCVADGYTIYTCANGCHKTENRDTTTKWGHIYSLTSVDFSEDGTTYTVTVTCSACDGSTEGHTKTSGRLNSTETGAAAGDCKTPSTKTYQAKGEVEGVVYDSNKTVNGANGDHSYAGKADEAYLKSAATCTAKAVYYKSCSVCGAAYKAETFVYGEPLGHEDAEKDGNHICDRDGCNEKVNVCTDSDTNHKCDECNTSMGEHKAAEGKHTCAYCGKTVTECSDGDDLNHNCDVCGKENITEHVYGTVTYTGNGKTAYKAERKCSCGDTQTATATITSKVTEEATCTEAGVRTYTVTFEVDWANGKITTESVDKLSHTMTHHAAEAATCVANGNVEYWSCSECQLNYSDEAGNGKLENVVIEKNPNAHDLKEVAAQAATCTDAGWNEYQECQREGCDYSTYIEIGAKGHAYTGEIKSDGNGKEATHSFKCVNGCNEYGAAVKHTWNEGKVTTSATCTSEGEKLYTCTVQGCGATYTEEVTALGHNMVAVDGKTATCTEDGYTAYTDCSRCDYIEGKTVISAGHTIQQGNAQEKTCTQDGWEAYEYCAECSYTTKVVIPAGHTLIQVEAKAATCTEAGYNAYEYCSACDYTTYEKVAAKGHTYGTVTYTGDGKTAYKAERKCSCGDTQPATASITSKVTKAATCTVAGETTYTATFAEDWAVSTTTTEEIAKLAHSYGTEWKYDTTNHWHECSCGDKSGVTGHTYTPEVTKAATCTEAGEKTYACDCGYSYTEAIEATGHKNTVTINAKDATCGAAGYTGDTYCNDCKTTIATGTTIDATGDHSYTEIVDTKYLKSAATCTAKAVYYKSCSVCGVAHETETFENGEVKGHSFTNYVSNGNATCTADGTKTAKCNRCDEIDTVTDEGSKLDHDMQKTADQVDATCEEAGKTAVYTCANGCGKTEGGEEIAALKHDMKETSAKEEPKCEVAGKTAVYTCANNCGKTEGGEEIAALGHDMKETAAAVAPTCETAGSTTVYTCANGCGKTEGGEEIAALKHDMKETSAKEEPKCEVAGKTAVYTCANGCGKTEGGEEIKGLGHDMQKTADQVDATCEVAGSTAVYTCANNCGKTEGGEVIPATGHSWDNGEVTKEPTEDEVGIRTYTCGICSAEKTEEIPELDHVHKYTSKVTEPTCTEGGYTTYTCACGDSYVADKVDALGHTEEIIPAKSATCTETGLTAGIQCSVCGEILVKPEVTDKAAHTEQIIPGSPATCTKKGLTDGAKCSVCGKTLKVQEEINILKHTEVIDKAVAATCTSTGKTEGKHCSVCNTVLVAQKDTAKLAHSEVKVSGKSATCTEKGLTDGSKCSVCGVELTAQKEIPAKGHTAVKVNGKAPTCAETGLTEGAKCSVCGTVTKAQTEIEKLAHTVVADEAVEATCTESGLTAGEHCSVCGTILKAQQFVPATHKVKTIPGKAVTCTEDGLTDGAVCSVCDKIITEQQPIVAVGHLYATKDNVDYNCINCDDGFSLDIRKIVESLLEEVASGTLTTEKVDDAVDKVQQIDTEHLEIAMKNDTDNTGVMKDIDQMEDLVEINVNVDVHEDTEHVFDEEKVSISGAKLNTVEQKDKDITLKVDKHKGDHEPEIPGEYNPETAVSFSMELENIENAKNLKVPVKITLPIPKEMNKDRVHVLHYNDDGSLKEIIIPMVVEIDGEHYACFVVTGFSNFAITEVHEHSYGEWTVIEAADCVTDGYCRRVCECGEEEIEKITATGHTVVIDKAVTATCTEKGLSSGKHCSVCEEVLRAQNVIPAQGHEYDEGECIRCGEADPGYVAPENPTEPEPTEPTPTEPKPSEPVEPGTPETDGVKRLAGDSRYETSFAIANEMKAVLGISKFESIILANSDNFADALAGSYLAAVKEAPIIIGKLKYAGIVCDYVNSNLTEGGTVYVLGGENAVPAAMLEGITVTTDFQRLAGDNRYETNLEILGEAGVAGKDILVATGQDFADSLSASATGLPILLVNGKPGKTLSEDQKAFLATVEGSIYIIGGESAVPESMVEQIETASGKETTRIAGNSRYETSVKIAEKFLSGAESAVVAYASTFPDGLCGGPLAYAKGAPLLLTKDGKTEAPTYAESKNITSGYVLGGDSLISNDFAEDIFNASEILK